MHAVVAGNCSVLRDQMEAKEEGDQKKLNLSYDVDVWGEKLRLIDINEEDDDFLIDFPSLDSVEDFRPSVTYNNYELEESKKNSENNRAKVDLKNDQIFAISDSIEPARRPSYLRQSMAWDDAFFTSAGVLDPSELISINNGLKADSDTKNSRHNAKTTISGKGFSSSAPRTPKLSAQQNKMKSERNFNDKTALQRSEKRDIKLSRSCDRMKSEDTSKSGSWITYDLKKNKKPATNESGKHAMLSKKLLSSSVSYDVASRYLPPRASFSASPKARTPVSAASYDVSSSVYRFTASKSDPRSKLFDSGSRSRTPPLSQMKKSQPQMENSSAKSPNVLNTSRRKSSLSTQSVKMNSLTPVKTQDMMNCSPGNTESRKRLKPSGLRQPLPRIGFFDEDKTTSANARLGFQLQFQKECSPLSTGKTPENLQLAKSTAMKASGNLKSRSNASHGGGRRNSDKPKARICSEKKDQDDDNSMLMENSKGITYAEMEKQIDDLSKCLEIIELDNESNGDSKKSPMTTTPKASQYAHKVTDTLPESRTPLLDKSSIFNRVKSLEFSGKSSRSKLNPKASLAVTPFRVTAKENSSPGLLTLSQL